MRLPNDVYQTLVDVCRSYPYAVIQDTSHLGEILNKVAWIHRDKGWGLSFKNGGTFVNSPVGPIAEDILQLQDGNHFDVLVGAGYKKPLNPNQADSIGFIDLNSRPWVAPKNVKLSWESGTPPVTPEKPTVECKFKPCECKSDFTDENILREIKSLRDRIDELAVHFDAIGARLIEDVNK